jgi:putative membrane protein
MTAVVWTFALLGAALHVVVFVWEALLFRRPGVHQRIFFVPTTDVPAVRLWAFGVGFYNLFLACGVVAGVIAWSTGDEAVGRALVIYVCLFWSCLASCCSSPTGWS